MKKITFFAIITLIISFLGSCKKEETNPYEGIAAVEGQVFEKGLIEKPIPNAMVVLFKVKSEGFFTPIHFISIDTTFTDKEGRYSMEYNPKGESNTYHITAYADPEQYWNRADEDVIGPGIREGIKVNNTLYIRPYGFIQIHIRNIKPVDEEDLLGISGPWNQTLSKPYVGNKIDTFFTTIFHANDSISINYSYKKTGLPVFENRRSYFAKSHDTLKININY